jgi:hypothetical protein
MPFDVCLKFTSFCIVPEHPVIPQLFAINVNEHFEKGAVIEPNWAIHFGVGQGGNGGVWPGHGSPFPVGRMVLWSTDRRRKRAPLGLFEKPQMVPGPSHWFCVLPIWGFPNPWGYRLRR